MSSGLRSCRWRQVFIVCVVKVYLSDSGVWIVVCWLLPPGWVRVESHREQMVSGCDTLYWLCDSDSGAWFVRLWYNALSDKIYWFLGEFLYRHKSPEWHLFWCKAYLSTHKELSVTFTWQWEKGCHKNLNAQEECFCLSWSLWNNEAQEKLLGPTATATHLLKNQHLPVSLLSDSSSWDADQQIHNSNIQKPWPPSRLSAADSGHRSHWGSPPRSCPSSTLGGKTTPSLSASPSQ